MTSLATTIMGLDLRSPIVVAACPISSYLNRIQEAEDHGAGAVVIRTLFEEQLADGPSTKPPLNPDSGMFFPHNRHGALAEHLHWVAKTRKQVSMPLIGSLNAEQPEHWVRYAIALQDSGCDALELNCYSVEADLATSSIQIEQRLHDTVAAVIDAVDIPVSVKLSPFYTALGHVAGGLAQAGVRALVFFNRFLQPSIDPHHMNLRLGPPPPSRSDEIGLPLRWTGLLAGRLGNCQLVLNTGVHNGLDVVRALLAGAAAAQCASALLEHGVSYLTVMQRQIEGWMHHHDMADIASFQGQLKDLSVNDPTAYERAQYMRSLLLHEPSTTITRLNQRRSINS